MKVALIFTGSSPILIITSYPSLEDKRFLEKLKHKGGHNPKRYCSRKCSNTHHYANPVMITVTKGERSKEIRPTNSYWYLNNGWERS